jgi:nucleoside-diphosphate-sugar epimerase
MDGLDPASVQAAVTAARPEVIVHQMTALATVSNLRHFDRAFALTNRLRTEGTRYLLDGAAKTGVRRVVAQSFTGWTNEREGSPVKDEISPLDPHPPKTMSQSLDAIAQLEQTVTTAAGVEGLVLRYGNFYGPGAPALSSTANPSPVAARSCSCARPSATSVRPPERVKTRPGARHA